MSIAQTCILVGLNKYDTFTVCTIFRKPWHLWINQIYITNDNCDENVLVWCEMGIIFTESVSNQRDFIGINLNGKFKMPTSLEKWNTFNRKRKAYVQWLAWWFTRRCIALAVFPIFVYFDVKQDRFLFSLRWSTQLLPAQCLLIIKSKRIFYHEKCFVSRLWTQAHTTRALVYMWTAMLFRVFACNRLINGHKFWNQTEPGSFQIIRAVFNLLRSFLIMT